MKQHAEMTTFLLNMQANTCWQTVVTAKVCNLSLPKNHTPKLHCDHIPCNWPWLLMAIQQIWTNCTTTKSSQSHQVRVIKVLPRRNSAFSTTDLNHFNKTSPLLLVPEILLRRVLSPYHWVVTTLSLMARREALTERIFLNGTVQAVATVCSQDDLWV